MRIIRLTIPTKILTMLRPASLAKGDIVRFSKSVFISSEAFICATRSKSLILCEISGKPSVLYPSDIRRGFLIMIVNNNTFRIRVSDLVFNVDQVSRLFACSTIEVIDEIEEEVPKFDSYGNPAGSIIVKRPVFKFISND